MSLNLVPGKVLTSDSTFTSIADTARTLPFPSLMADAQVTSRLPVSAEKYGSLHSNALEFTAFLYHGLSRGSKFSGMLIHG